MNLALTKMALAVLEITSALKSAAFSAENRAGYTQAG